MQVVYEGSMDKSTDKVHAQRPPMCTDGLTSDQINLVEKRLKDCINNKLSQMTQTDSVRILDSDDDTIRLIRETKQTFKEQT